MTLWVIDPSLNNPEDQGVAEILRGWSGQSRLFRPALDGDGPDTASGYDAAAIVLMGSAASVYDELDWLVRLRAWLRPIVDGEIERPLLGLCFGHQLLGEMAGVNVAFLQTDRRKRVGVETTRVCASRLFPEPAELRVVVSHREVVTETPRGYRVTASRPGVVVDGLEHERRPLFSYQFHPEAREQFAGRAGIAAEEIDAGVRADSRRVLDAFLSIA